MTVQLAYPGVMYPGEGAYPGAAVEGFGEAWGAVIDSWKSHEKGKRPGSNDRLHVETHVLEKRDVFITDDLGLRVMCRRLRDEHEINVEAMSLEEYLNGRRGPPRS
jgi:hypothetical protein